MASNALADIANALASVRIATSVAAAIGLNVPPEFATFENDALVALNAVQGFEPPANLAETLKDVVAAANGLSGIVNLPNLAGILQAITKIRSLDQGLTSGNVAVIGSAQCWFNGTADRVYFGAWRATGPFADIVNTGTTDTSVTQP